MHTIIGSLSTKSYSYMQIPQAVISSPCYSIIFLTAFKCCSKFVFKGVYLVSVTVSLVFSVYVLIYLKRNVYF